MKPCWLLAWAQDVPICPRPINPHCARLPAEAEKYRCGAGLQMARSTGADILTLDLIASSRCRAGTARERGRGGGEEAVVNCVGGCCRCTYYGEVWGVG